MEDVGELKSIEITIIHKYQQIYVLGKTVYDTIEK